MIDAHFAILAAVITVAGNAVYAVDTVRGNTQPNRVSWMLWTLAPLIAFAAEVSQGVGLQSLLTFAIGFGPLLVVCASFLDPKAYARVTLFDVLCGVLSLIALVVTGASDMVSVVVRQTLVQLKTPNAMRGRVSAVNMMFVVSSNELGEFESGITAAWLGAVNARANCSRDAALRRCITCCPCR